MDGSNGRRWRRTRCAGTRSAIRQRGRCCSTSRPAMTRPPGGSPSVYFLHGFSGSARGWTNVSAFQPSVPERLDALVASGALPPIVGVFVDGWSALGGSQWLNSEAIGRYRDYVARDVVTFVDGRCRTVPRAAARAVVGKSSGGYGALVMGAHHPDVFGHVASHAGDAGSSTATCRLPARRRRAAGHRSRRLVPRASCSARERRSRGGTTTRCST